MRTTARHPYRAALESRDVEGLMASLHPDVTFYSPLLDFPLQGRERALEVFAAIAGVVDEFEVTDELAGEDTLALTFRVRFDGHQIDAADHLQLDEEGRVRSIVVSMRPRPAVQALAVRMAPKLADIVAGVSGQMSGPD